MILTKENIAAINIDKLIDEKISRSKVNELLIIVPTNRKARNLKKEIITRISNQAVSGLNVETLGTISSKLLQTTKPFKQLSEAAATVFIKQSAEELSNTKSERSLKYFSQYKDEIPFGTLEMIKNVISEYKRQSITPEILLRESEKIESSEKLKAIDIANIYKCYRDKCYQLHAYEIGDIYDELNSTNLNEFVSSFRKIFDEVNLIIIDGFDEFSNSEMEIINRLSFVGNSKLFLGFDYSHENKLIFSHLDKCFFKLNELGFIQIEDSSGKQENEFKRIIRQKLFLSADKKSKEDYTKSITKISAFDREREVELISLEIKKLLIDKKAEPDKIAVAFNLIQNYSSAVKDIFNKNGIPFNLTDRTPLDNSSPVTAIVNYLEIAENNFYFKNIFRALSSGFINTENIDTSNLYRVASELKIVAGKENWLKTINTAMENLKYKGDDEEDSSKYLTYQKALADIKNIEENLTHFDKQLTIAEFQIHLNSFIIKTNLPRILLKVEIEQEKNVRAFTDFLETISEMFGLLAEQHGSQKKFAIGFFMDQIRTACNWARFNVKEKSGYGVLVTSLEEIRGLEFDYLFIGGMCDTDFPTRYSPEIFYSGSFKKQALVHQNEERFRFYQSLCSWNKKLYLTLPLTSSGKEITSSTFLKDFEDLFIISSKTEVDFENIIYSDEELQKFVGKAGIEKSKNVFGNKNLFDFEKLENAIAVDKIREKNPFESSLFSGSLVPQENTNIQKEKLKTFADRQYSVSQLEVYAKCPFKFFIERVLNVEAVEEPTEDIEAVEMGRLLHSILYEFYTTIRIKKINLIKCSSKEFNTAEKLIFDIAEKHLMSTAFKSPLTFYEKEKILGIDSNRQESILYKFLEAERKCEDDFIPKFFEVSFGRLRESDKDNLLGSFEPVIIENIKLRGKIDRIEVNENLKSFNIVDYKLSGAKPSFDDLKNGISLQLPIYLLAASELLSKKFNEKYSPNEMFIYSLKYAVDDFGKKKVKSIGNKNEEIQSIEQLVDKTVEHVKKYISQLSEGKFNLSPHANREKIVCRYCQFRTVCRIDEVSI